MRFMLLLCKTPEEIYPYLKILGINFRESRQDK